MMSADRWTQCPQCLERHELKLAASQKNLCEAYGEMTQDEWLAFKEEVDSPDPLEETLREDYEQGLDSETYEYSVAYSCSCSVCGWGHKFNHKHDARTHAPENQ